MDLFRRFSLIAAPGMVAALSLPFVASASSFKEIVNGPISHTGDLIIVLLYAFAFLVFVYGLLRYFFTQGEEGREKGKQLILWGIISFVVLFAVWGIVKIFLSLLQSWSA